ncbi:phosphate acetyltransferase [Nakamurella sp. A5-74]|uniref:Phosphate acetyltransferase n=1 Tax=Nakamurella sp. A5-74 TaxID=3158264 RepID=A0AAU8DS07_9ACTN
MNTTRITRVMIASVEGESGKSTVALGLLDALAVTAGRVGVYRPVVRDGVDHVLQLLLAQLPGGGNAGTAEGVHYSDVHRDPQQALQRIVDGFRAACEGHDAMVIVGSDFSGVPTPTEFGFNAVIAANLDAPIVLVLSGSGRSAADLATAAEVSIGEARGQHVRVLSVVANRVTDDPGVVRDLLTAATSLPCSAIPEIPLLQAPTVRELVAAVEGTVITGDEVSLDAESIGVMVAAMTMPHVLDRLTESIGVVCPADRDDVLLGLLVASASRTFPSPSAVFLNGDLPISPQVRRLIDGLHVPLPLISCSGGSMATASALAEVRGRLTAEATGKIAAARAVFAEHVDVDILRTMLGDRTTGAVTPLMFEQQLVERAREHPAHIVLPEGDDDRVLRAAHEVLARRIAELTILGEPPAITARAAALGLDLAAAHLVSPTDPERVEQFATRYAELRAHKGVTVLQARGTVTDVSYFGTMMVLLGQADGMVSGARHTTANTIRPALEVVKTVPGVSVVSSVFFMCLADRVLVYGDCAVNPEPDSDQLADIALSSAETAATFGIEPRVAMLSYATGSSGSGAEVDKVRVATDLVRARRPGLLVEGPIQYDAAVDPEIGASKVGADNPVAGRATVLIFPDLNTGNNTYKAVQRSAGAVAIGPVLQGLRRPINDLSRGATVRDIVNTVAITAVQGAAGKIAETSR